MTQDAAILVEVTRGRGVESVHRGRIAVTDASGAVVLAVGAIDTPVFPRSSIKALQALPFVESGARDRFGFGAREVALACASHSGEAKHSRLALAMLSACGLGAGDLGCGAHAPLNTEAAAGLIRAGGDPGAEHNNCSGKHAAMLATCRHLGEPTHGYTTVEHPCQMRVRDAIAEMTGADLAATDPGLDGCSLPTYPLPLVALARAMARIADPAGLGTARARAVGQIRAAWTGHPDLVAGTGRFDTRLMTALCGAVATKVGAEACYCAAWPDRGLGIAVKIDDGADRAAEVALAATLRRLGAMADLDRALFETPALTNRAGATIGHLRPTGPVGEGLF